MTEELLTEFWPAVVRRLRMDLRGRGLDPHSVEDLCQQTWVRAFEHRHRIGPTLGDLTRWAKTVAYRDATKLLRRLNRVEVDGLANDGWVPDAVSPLDVEREVEARIALGRVLGAVTELPAAEHAAVVGALAGRSTGATKREQSTASMRLVRARERLRRISGPLAGFGFRPWRWRLAASDPSPVVVASGSVLLAAGVVASLAMLGPPGGPGAETRPSLVVLGSSSLSLASGPGDVAVPKQPAPTARSAPPPATLPSSNAANGDAGPTSVPDSGFSHVAVPVVGPVTDDQRPGEPLACAYNLRYVPDQCVAHPLRDPSNPTVPDFPQKF